MGRRAFYYFLTAAILSLLLLPLLAVSQVPTTVGITAQLGDISGAAATSGTAIQVKLAGCGGNQPRITGYFGIVQTQMNFYPNPTTGMVTGTLWPNDVITCGTTTGSTQYLFTFIVNNVPQGPALCYQINSGQNPFNLNTATPCNVFSVPPPPTPPFDGTFHMLNLTGLLTGTSAIFTGNVRASTFTMTTAPGDCGAGQYSTGIDSNFNSICLTLPSTPAGVTSFNTRQNAVVPELGDYNCAQVTNCQSTLNFATGDFSVSGGTVSLAAKGTAGTYAYPTSMTTDADGRVTAITGGTAPGGTPRTCNANGCYKIDQDGTIEQWGVSAAVGTGSATAAVAVPFPFPFTTTANLSFVAYADNCADTCAGKNPISVSGNGVLTTTGTSVQFTGIVPTGGGGASLLIGVHAMWHAIGN